MYDVYNACPEENLAGRRQKEGRMYPEEDLQKRVRSASRPGGWQRTDYLGTEKKNQTKKGRCISRCISPETRLVQGYTRISVKKQKWREGLQALKAAVMALAFVASG